jgi:hypothetical protein
LTDTGDDEIDPIYLPDGDIVFASSAAHRYVPCSFTEVANLYRCDANGRNIRRLTCGLDSERTASP